MQFNKPLFKLKGTIISLKSRGLLNKEDSIKVVVEELGNVTKNQTDHVKSEMVLFLILITDLDASEKLRQDELVHFQIDSPFFRINYLITYVYYLNLQSKMFKVIENCSGTLGSELAKAILENLENPNFHRNEFGSRHFYELLESIFVKAFKIKFGFHSDSDLDQFVHHFNKNCALIQKILVKSMTLENLEDVAGLQLYYFFCSCLFLIKFHKRHNLCDDPLYNIGTEHFRTGSVDKISVMAFVGDLLWDKIIKILEELTLNLWMTLSERYFDFDSEYSIQLLIGDVVQSILVELNDWNAPSDILNCLSNLAINKLDVARLDEIISHINNGKKEWLEALIKHPDITEKKSLECLIKNIALANADEVERILNISYKFITSDEQDGSSELMKDLFFAALKETSRCSQWLEKVFENYKPDLLLTAHTQDNLIKAFNKTSSGGCISETDLICLCMQSPLETLKKICHQAVFGSLQTKDVIENLKILQYPCKAFQWDGSACIDYVVLKCLLQEDFTSKEKSSFIDLIACLGKENLLGPYFGKNLLKALKAHLETAALEKCGLCLEILKIMLNLKLIVIDDAALLVLLSQALEHLAWDLKSYSPLKSEGRDLIVCIVAAIVGGLEVGEDGSKYSWAHEEIAKSGEVNRACFCDLWFRFGAKWPSSRRVDSYILTLAHSHHRVQDLRRFLAALNKSAATTSIVLSLTLLLPVLAFREWNSIFDGLIIVLKDDDSEKGKSSAYHNVLDMFGTSLYLLTPTLEGPAVYPCYEYCLRNFGRLVASALPKSSGGSLAKVIEKIFFILTSIEDEGERKSCWIIFSPLLLELIDRVKDGERRAMEKLVPLVEPKDMAEAFARRLDS